MVSAFFMEVFMARLILHARYFAPNAKKRVSKLSYLMKYYGTREGVEKPMQEAWKKEPVSEAQTKSLDQIVKELPEVKDTHEWEDYEKEPNQGNASEVIRWATEYQYQSGNADKYLQYIAERPRVEKIGDHGLFTQSDDVIDLNAVTKTVSEHPGNVWTMVYSLRRKDAERLGYNNAAAWQTLCRAKSSAIAQAMKIPEQDFHWYAAFHNESHHPHIHMVAYSTGEEGFLTKYGIDDIKSAFATEIFQLDLQEIYQAQTQYRNDLRRMAKEYMQQLRDLPQVASELSSLVPILMEIKRRLPEKGKLKYGYMPKDVKNLVDEVVDKLERNPKVAELYDLWYRQKCAIIATYTSNFPPKEPLSENETFRPIKNAVLETANEMPLVMMTEGARVLKNETQARSDHQILEETLARIEREHQVTEEISKASREEYEPSFRSVESFLYRVSKVFEDKRPIGEQGQVMDKKMYVRQEERKRELGMQ